MAVTSNMLPLGTEAPRFSLPDTVSGSTVSLEDVKSERATVVMFLCNHCPYVKHIIDEVVNVAREYEAKGARFVAISSNDVSAYPDDSPENMKRWAREKGFPFPYLFDESQEVARAYQAACTPDLYVFDGGLELVYRGRFDAATPGNEEPVTGRDLRAALDAVLEGRAVSGEQKPSMGCNIKWKQAA